jgi:PAS domain S-box-containing protein
MRLHFALIFSVAAATLVYWIMRRSLLALDRLRKLLEAEKIRLEAVLNQIQSGVIFVDLTGKVITYNRRAQELLDVNITAGMDWNRERSYQGRHPDGKPYQTQDWPLSRTLLSGVTISDEEIEVVTSVGKLRILQISTSPILNSEGRQTGVVASFYDVSAHKENERLLQKSLGDYQAIVNTVDGIVWEADRNFAFTFVSKQAERLLGYPVEVWLNEKDFWINHLHPDDREWAIGYCQEHSVNLKPHDFEYRMIAANGNTVWVRDLVTIKVEEGQFVGLRGIIVDVTANKRVREELDRSLSVLHATLESTADGILVVDQTGSVSAYNRKFLELWKIPSELMVGRSDQHLIEHVINQVKDPGNFLSKVRDLYTHPENLSFDVIEFKDGTVYERYSQPQRIGDRIVGRVWSFRNVTDRIKIEKDKEALFVLERQSRLEAQRSVELRDEFLSVASHELKNPITPIRLILSLLRRDIEALPRDFPKSMDLLNGIVDTEKQFERLLKLVDKLLDVSRISSDRLLLDREEFDLAAVVTKFTEHLSPEFEKAGCPLILTVPKEMNGIWDRLRIEQILMNLLLNALKFGAGKPIEVSLSEKDGRAILVIRDHGIGIAHEDQTKLFERFGRISPAKHSGGMGLGLYICRSIIAAHGGKITIDSELGKGATFIVELPLRTQSEAVKQAA